MNRVPAIALGPLLISQALRLRAATPRMPIATGERITGDGILILGDSTAVGAGVDSLDDALPGHLSRALGLGYTVIGKSGVTSREIREQYLAEALTVPADLVILVVGWNDAMQLRTSRSVSRDVTTIVRELQAARIGRRVAIVEPPHFESFTVVPQPMRWALGITATGIRRAMRQLAGKWGAVVTPGFDGENVANDRFHPNSVGYELMADNILGALALDTKRA